MCLVALKSMSHPQAEKPPRRQQRWTTAALHGIYVESAWQRIELSRTTAATAAVSLVPQSAVQLINWGKCKVILPTMSGLGACHDIGVVYHSIS